MNLGKTLLLCLLFCACRNDNSSFRNGNNDNNGLKSGTGDSRCAMEFAHLGFISEWKMEAGEELRLPLPAGFNYEFAIDWGDGSTEKSGNPYVSAHDDPATRHVYEQSGTYEISIHGLVEAWSFQEVPDNKNNLVAVKELGDVGWKNLNGAFAACENLGPVKGGQLSQVTDMSDMFTGARAVKPDLSTWNLALVENMEGMFSGVTLTEEAYDQLLNRIVSTTTQRNVVLDGGNSRYSPAAAASREKLVNAGWQISDGGASALNLD